MIDVEKQAAVTFAVNGGGLRADPLTTMSKAELRKLRNEIDKLLPPLQTVGDLNLEVELVEQYQKTKDLMDSVTLDEGVPVNQRAQVCNAVVTALQQLVKLQEDLKKQETLKIMEACLIDAVKVLPQVAKDAFFIEYERLAAKAGLM